MSAIVRCRGGRLRALYAEDEAIGTPLLDWSRTAKPHKHSTLRRISMNYLHATLRRMIASLVLVMFVLTLTLATIPASAQTFQVLYDGTRGTGTNTQDFKFTQARDGNLYVTALSLIHI